MKSVKISISSRCNLWNPTVFEFCTWSPELPHSLLLYAFVWPRCACNRHQHTKPCHTAEERRAQDISLYVTANNLKFNETCTKHSPTSDFPIANASCGSMQFASIKRITMRSRNKYLSWNGYMRAQLKLLSGWACWLRTFMLDSLCWSCLRDWSTWRMATVNTNLIETQKTESCHWFHPTRGWG